jgi:PAS domain S-box-containing protein
MSGEEGAERRRAQLFRSFVESSQDVFLAVRHDGIIEYASSGVQSLLGYDAEEVVGRNVVDWLNPDEIDRALIQLGESEGHLVKGVTRFSVRTADGRFVPIELEGAPVSDGEREYIGLYGRDGRDQAFIETIMTMLLDGTPRETALARVIDTIGWQSMHSLVAVGWIDGSGYHDVKSGEFDDALAGRPADEESDDEPDEGDPWTRARATREPQRAGVTDEIGELRDLAESAGLDSYWVEAVDWDGAYPPATITIWLTAEHSSEVHTYGMAMAKVLVELILRWTEHVPRR